MLNFTDLINKIHNVNAIQFMRDLPDKSIDCVITDPPYGISKELTISRGKNGMKFKGKDVNYNFGKWDVFKDEQSKLDFTFEWLIEVNRILKEDAVLITFFDRDKINYISDFMREKQFKRRNYIYFVKLNPVPQARKINWQSSVEQAVILTRGKHHYNWQAGQHKEYWLLPICSGNERTIHPTQKPLKIFYDLVKWWTFQEDIIYDPFIGSGTTVVACRQLNRKFIGTEINAEYCQIAERRLFNTQPDLF